MAQSCCCATGCFFFFLRKYLMDLLGNKRSMKQPYKLQIFFSLFSFSLYRCIFSLCLINTVLRNWAWHTRALNLFFFINISCANLSIDRCCVIVQIPCSCGLVNKAQWCLVGLSVCCWPFASVLSVLYWFSCVICLAWLRGHSGLHFGSDSSCGGRVVSFSLLVYNHE